MDKRTKYSPEFLQQLALLRAGGESMQALADKFSLPLHTVDYLLRKSGQKLPKEKKSQINAKHAGKREEIKRLRLTGVPLKDIADKVQVPFNSVKRIVKEMKVRISQEEISSNIAASRIANRDRVDRRFGTTRTEAANELAKQRGGTIINHNVDKKGTVLWRCKEGHDFLTSIYSVQNRNYWCPQCSGKQVSDKNNLKVRYPMVALEWDYVKNGNLKPEHLTPFANKKAHFLCLKDPTHSGSYCRIADRVSEKSGCSDCSKKHTKLEMAGELLLGGVKNTESPIKDSAITSKRPIPDLKISETAYVDFHGLHWHCAKYQHPNHHRDRRRALEKCGFKLFEFWEDEVHQKSSVVKSIVDNYLGLSAKLGARETELDTSPLKLEMMSFFATNHLIGEPTSSRFLALRNKTGQVVMGLAYKEHKQKATKAAYIEVVRVCALVGVTVQGGLSKLLKPLLKRGVAIRTMIDCRYADGHAWAKMGFVKIPLRPNYQYTNNYVRSDKRNFRVPAGVNEEEEALKNGWRRLYDSGRFRLELPSASP